MNTRRIIASCLLAVSAVVMARLYSDKRGLVAVGMPVTLHPPDRSVRAELPGNYEPGPLSIKIEEEFMFTADIPYEPVWDTQPVFVAKDESLKRHNEVRLTGCQDVDSTFPNSAFNSLGVLGGEVFKRLGYPWSAAEQMYIAPQEAVAAMKVTILQPPHHGMVERAAPNLGWWQYKPVAGYVGKDRVTFLVEADGRRFKITWNLLVHEIVDENANPPTCEKIFPKGNYEPGPLSIMMSLAPYPL